MEKEHSTNGSFMIPIKTFYKIILPTISILSLGISQFLERPKFLGSFMDFVIRLVLCVWFCFAYRGLVPIQKSLMYPTLIWSKLDLKKGEKIICLIQAIGFGIMVTIITWWSVNKFLPILREYNFILSVLNGLIFLIPLVIQYEKFRIM